MIFFTGPYFATAGSKTFYPLVEVRNRSESLQSPRSAQYADHLHICKSRATLPHSPVAKSILLYYIPRKLVVLASTYLDRSQANFRSIECIASHRLVVARRIKRSARSALSCRPCCRLLCLNFRYRRTARLDVHLDARLDLIDIIVGETM